VTEVFDVFDAFWFVTILSERQLTVVERRRRKRRRCESFRGR